MNNRRELIIIFLLYTVIPGIFHLFNHPELGYTYLATISAYNLYNISIKLK
jgi:hypothetical protein